MKNLGAVLPPLGIAYIASMLEKDGHKVKIIDGPAWATIFEYDFDNLEKDISDFKPDVVGLSSSTSQVEHAKKTIKLVKKINKDAVIVMGGPLISADPKILLGFEGVDYGVFGEADLTFSVIIKAIGNKESLIGVEGVIWRDNGKVKFLKPKMVTNLDQIPMPARHLFWRVRHTQTLRERNIHTDSETQTPTLRETHKH